MDPVKMAGSAQEEETCCHKHVSLSLNTDDTEVPITQPECRVCVECWLCVDMGVTQMHDNLQLVLPILNLFTSNN